MPDDMVLDGGAVIGQDDRLDFELLPWRFTTFFRRRPADEARLHWARSRGAPAAPPWKGFARTWTPPLQLSPPAGSEQVAHGDVGSRGGACGVNYRAGGSHAS